MLRLFRGNRKVPLRWGSEAWVRSFSLTSLSIIIVLFNSIDSRIIENPSPERSFVNFVNSLFKLSSDNARNLSISNRIIYFMSTTHIEHDFQFGIVLLNDQNWIVYSTSNFHTRMESVWKRSWLYDRKKKKVRIIVISYIAKYVKIRMSRFVVLASTYRPRIFDAKSGEKN